MLKYSQICVYIRIFYFIFILLHLTNNIAYTVTPSEDENSTDSNKYYLLCIPTQLANKTNQSGIIPQKSILDRNLLDECKAIGKIALNTGIGSMLGAVSGSLVGTIMGAIGGVGMVETANSITPITVTPNNVMVTTRGEIGSIRGVNVTMVGVIKGALTGCWGGALSGGMTGMTVGMSFDEARVTIPSSAILGASSSANMAAQLVLSPVIGPIGGSIVGQCIGYGVKKVIEGICKVRVTYLAPDATTPASPERTCCKDVATALAIGGPIGAATGIITGTIAGGILGGAGGIIQGAWVGCVFGALSGAMAAEGNHKESLLDKVKKAVARGASGSAEQVASTITNTPIAMWSLKTAVTAVGTALLSSSLGKMITRQVEIICRYKGPTMYDLESGENNGFKQEENIVLTGYTTNLHSKEDTSSLNHKKEGITQDSSHYENETNVSSSCSSIVTCLNDSDFEEFSSSDSGSALEESSENEILLDETSLQCNIKQSSNNNSILDRTANLIHEYYNYEGQLASLLCMQSILTPVSDQVAITLRLLVQKAQEIGHGENRVEFHKQETLSYGFLHNVRGNKTNQLSFINELMSPINIFASMDSYESNLENKNHSGQFGMIMNLNSTISAGLLYSCHIDNGMTYNNKLELGVVGGAIKAKTKIKGLSTNIAIKPKGTELAIYLANFYGWGSVKTIRSVMYVGQQTESKGNPTITLSGGLVQLAYPISLENFFCIPYIEGVFSQVQWSSYKELSGMFPSNISRNKERIWERSIGIRGQWNSKTAQFQTWVANISTYRSCNKLISKSLVTTNYKYKVWVPKQKNQYAKTELGISYTKYFSPNFEVGLNGILHINNIKKFEHEQISIPLRYLY